MKILIILIILIIILLSLGIAAFILNAVKKTPVSDCEKMMKIYEFINATDGWKSANSGESSTQPGAAISLHHPVSEVSESGTGTDSSTGTVTTSASGTGTTSASGTGTTSASGTGTWAGEITLAELKKQDPECIGDLMSKLLDCTKKYYNLDKLYNIVLKKDFTNTYFKHYKNTYNSKCNGSGSGSGSGSGTGTG